MSQQNQPPSSSRPTFSDHPHNESETEQDPSSNTASVQSILGAEETMERYGGDDIHEPSPKKAIVRNPSALVPQAPTVDANMVTWDSPNDSTNPQNWSIGYKWLVTAVCIAMSINVYV